MPSVDRDSSRDNELRLKHQHSASFDHGRAVVPMSVYPVLFFDEANSSTRRWDSSDPDRAPPPLPLNPVSSPSRPNTSPAIQSAHAALTEKARESAYTINPLPERKRNDISPERLLIKGAAHKRMQSLQTGHVRDLSNYLENNQSSPSPAKSPEKISFRPTTPTTNKDLLLEGKSFENYSSRSGSPTPTATGKDATNMRQFSRKGQQSILGENTSPQSSTMLALHNMSVRVAESPPSNLSNGSNALVRTPQTFDAISNQILSLTSICTGLQREMANLSRRSKDNATDLISLKAATNARDEDIRKSLRDLVTNLSDTNSKSSSTLLIDDKAHSPNTRFTKTVSLPRIPSPTSFSASLDREAALNSSSYHTDGAASIALLEKILRDMGTKEGQDLLLGRLTTVADRLAQDGIATTKKIDDLVQFIKANSETRPLAIQNGRNGSNVKSRKFSFDEPPRLELDSEETRSGPVVSTVHNVLGASSQKENCAPTTSRAPEALNDDLMKIIRSVKDSVSQGGGLTAEVKALVRELRGEVLGMGREIGRKLEEASSDKDARDTAAESAHVTAVVQEGLDKLRQHLVRVMQDFSQQSQSVPSAGSMVDGQEIYNAVKSAMSDSQALQLASQNQDIDKEDIIRAFKEAWDNYKPNIEVQHFGLERDELLACLREGIQEYAPQNTDQQIGVTRDEVFAAVVEGLKHFSPSQVQNEPSLSREDILDAVRDCLEEFEFPAAPSTAPVVAEITRGDMLDAVREGLHTFEFPTNNFSEIREPSGGLSREDIFDAVKESLSNLDLPSSEPAISRDDIFDAVKETLSNLEFPSAESAVSRDDIFDAVKECLNSFDFPRPEPAVSRDDVFDAVKECLNEFDFPTNNLAVANDITGGLSREDVYDAVKASLNGLELPGNDPAISRDDILDAVKEGLSNFEFPNNELVVAKDIPLGLSREDVYDAVKDGLCGLELPGNDPAISKDDILAAVKEGLSDFENHNNELAVARDIPQGLSREDVYDAVKDGLKGLELPTNDFALLREGVLDAVKEGLINFEFSNNELAVVQGQDGGLSREDVFDAVKAGLGELPSMTTETNDDISCRLQEIIDCMRGEFQAVSEEAKQNMAANGRDTEQLLDATKDGFEKLRSDIETYVDRAADVTGKDEIINSMRESFDTLRDDISTLVAQGVQGSDESVKEELDHLRETIATSLVRGGAEDDKDEIINAFREGLESLRADIEHPRDNGESILSGTGEILDALQDGLTSLRTEVEKIGDKPVDLTVNYEILDTLKTGLEGVRADIDRLRESGQGQGQMAAINAGAVVSAEDVTEHLKRKDIENLEVLITQLRIKIEAIEAMPPPPQPETNPDALLKEDLANVEEAVRNVHATVSELSAQERATDEPAVRKEDFEAIETLLRNTKAKLDELDPEQAVRKDQLDAVELVVRETRDSLNEIFPQITETSRKEDLSLVEALVKEVIIGVEELKERSAQDVDDEEKASKTQVEAVEALCQDVKTQLEQLAETKLAGLVSKEDMKSLEEMVKEFKDRVEIHAESNAQAFEERQAETVGVGERVTEVKTFLEEFKDAVKEKFDHGATGVEALGQVISGLGETVGENAASTKEILEAIKNEFEKSNAEVAGAKLETDERFEKTWEKFEQKYDELMTKFDDAQLASEAKIAAGDERVAATEAAVLSTKTIAEELKLATDTLGTTLTKSVEKMDESSKTVFHRVEDTYAKIEENHADAKNEHQLTREDVLKTLNAMEGVDSHINEFQPKIFESIKDVLLIVGQHYEHSKVSVDALQEKIAEATPPKEEQPLLTEPPPVEKYDDTPVHEKLDKLVDSMQAAGQSFAQLEILGKIHAQVMQTAAEVSDFISAQTQRIADDHEDKEKAVEEATIALERRRAEKEIVEVEVGSLHAEEKQLKDSVNRLRVEQQQLATQKMRLAADVSSLETALRIRREELNAMEARAEGLERRILEGVIDHSRAFLISKPNKGRSAMDLKRVPSQASTTSSFVSSSPSRIQASKTTRSAVGMAMAGNRAPPSIPVNHVAATSRRNFSLNQITNNVANGGFKRSHSVKASGGGGGLRKTSWGGSLNRNYGELNKENLAQKENEDNSDTNSDAGTMRRTSRGTDFTGATIDEGTEWSGEDGETQNENGPVVLYEAGEN